ncbi:MAG: hypothetical protein DRH90_25760 [Deltaproteobacteria bacterium]|nr:MAG: hypothetical protein DRH90_25760 [Deltaproteobacteria bacterium]
MTVQNFNIYTARGYAGDLCDNGPIVSITGVVEAATLEVGIAVKRGTVATNPKHVLLDADGGNIYGIVRRELALEAKNRPSDGVVEFVKTESASILRQGYIYVELTTTAATAGDKLYVTAAGVFSGSTGTVTTNVTAEQSGAAGDIIKARIDIL